MRATVERLVTALADLPVVIEGAHCVSRDVAVRSYDGLRPSSVVTLLGAGRGGQGEHVGWTRDAHAAFRDAVAAPRFCGTWRLGMFAGALAGLLLTPYDRAAIEMAAIELALRQRTTTLGALAGVTPRPIRRVVSFARVSDPAAEAARHAGSELKIDVDPSWTATTWQSLADTGRVAILDWKGLGDDGAYARALRVLPNVLHEDPAPPYPPGIAKRLALDAPITTLTALTGVAPAACNLKPARMGGMLNALVAAGVCAARGIDIYLGGMFEVDVGRRQLCEVAAVICPDGPNDLAPIPLAAGPATP